MVHVHTHSNKLQFLFDGLILTCLLNKYDSVSIVIPFYFCLIIITFLTGIHSDRTG